MSMSLAGWRRVLIDGGVRLIPPPAVSGVIQIRHRLPLQPVRVVIDQLRRVAIGGAALHTLVPPRMITTDEGEYGAVIQLGSGAGGRDVRRTVGLVFGDDWMSMVDGRVASADHVADFGDLVEKLTMSLSLGLGTDRWRRFLYQPPRGWNGYQRPRADVWLAPGFPKPFGMITVYYARPERETRSMVQHHKLFEELTSEYGGTRGEPRPVQTRAGMMGQAVSYEAVIGGVARRAGNVVFGDGRYSYLLRIETDDANKDAHTDLFLRTIESIESCPWPRQDLVGLIHWSE